MTRIVREFVQALPLIVFAAVILLIAWYISSGVNRLVHAHLMRRWQSKLLAKITARAISIPFFLLGLYLILQVSGLTRLALTVVVWNGCARDHFRLCVS